MQMKYEVILEKGEYSLIIRGSQMEEYAVVNGLNKERGDWAWTGCYYNFGNFTQIDKTEALAKALDYFRMRTELNYIPRCRLEELATQLKDGLIEDDKESAMEYFDEVCEMTNEEKQWFGIRTESEEK